MLNIQRLMLVLFLSILASTTQAAMLLDKAIVHFGPGAPSRQDVEIRNPDKEPMYIKVEILEVLNPGAENEERKVVTNPKAAKFLVTPSKLVIPPGGRKSVRMLNIGKLPVDKDKVFRINLTPVTPDVEAKQMAIKVVVGYQLLVLIQPNTPKADIQATRDGKKLVLHNAGNTNVLLRSGSNCPKQAPPPAKPSTEGCVEMQSKRLYAGNTAEVELTYDTPVEYFMAIGLNNQKAVY
jgi:P pilus assembly chaperone PapD